MQTLKIWQLLALTYGFCIAVEFEPCSDTVKSGTCNMTCHVPDYSKTILITCNGSTRGSCTFLGCGSNIIKEGGNAVHLEILSLSYTSDNCEWSCTYGTASASPINVTIYSGIPIAPNLTSQKDADGVKFTAIADCLYPSNPDVVLQYSEVFDGEYVSLAQRVDLQSSTTPGGCSDAIEKRVTAISDVSAKHKDLAGKSIFFRMKFSQYTPGPENYTNVQGPFYFEDCSLDIFLYGFLPDFLIVLIVSIVIIIILKIECLPKQFGGLTWKKLGIIAVCFVVAIIIGVCLGLLIKGCDNKLLALCLSLLFGILLVVALISALIYYHKKFESRRDIQDGGAQDGNGLSLDSCFRKCKVKPEKEMSSQNNTGSNTTRTTTERVGLKSEY